LAQCLSDELVLELVHGKLGDAVLGSVEQHLAVCADCRTLVAETAAVGSRTDATTEPVRVDDAAPLARGARVGRFEVEDMIGAGGIGLVYAARDPELHRRVALKVMRSSALPIGPAGDVRSRMLREARAMAQLSHPNVVTVYDVGTYDDRVFLAMELVAGATLRRWLKAAPRTLAEILDVFRAAGDGLAAAHRIGLVHRDFKPENVLVGDDGRVRVTDFGLARSVDWDTGSHTAIDTAALATAHPALTRTGMFAGTPAYMAPEQFAGEAPDPRSDQFGFCVTLYEALYGERPFAGVTSEEVAASIISGVIRAPRATALAVTPGLRATIERGLRKNPSDRFPTMSSLLEGLTLPVAPAAPPPRRRGWLAGAAAVAVAAAGAAVVMELRQPDAPAPAAAAAATVAQPPTPAPTPAPTPMPPAPRPEPAATPAVVKSDPPPPKRTAKRHAARPTAPKPATPPPQPPPPARVGDGLKDPF
jgi:eukaryotic-like serine/threonine-protein kinase